MSSSNYNGDVSIIRQSLHCIEKDFDKKVQKTKNFLKQTTLSLQKISDSKIELIQSSTSNIKSIESSKRKISISNLKELSKESEQQSFNSKNDVKKNSEISINQNTSQNLINLNMQVGSVEVQSINIVESLIQDNISSKCSIQIDIKAQECSRQSENPLLDQQEIYIDGNNELEKRIHQWLDNEGVKMVSPCKKYQDYFDHKRQQILVMYKKKSNNTMHISHQLHNNENNQTIQIHQEKQMSCSQSASPQKYFNSSKLECQQKLITLRTPQKNMHNGPEIIANSLFNTSITDSPLMQRRRIMLQSNQDRDPAQYTQEKKKNNFLQLNPANSGVKSSLAHLSQYKRQSQSKSNNEITSADISADCK